MIQSHVLGFKGSVEIKRLHDVLEVTTDWCGLVMKIIGVKVRRSQKGRVEARNLEVILSKENSENHLERGSMKFAHPATKLISNSEKASKVISQMEMHGHHKSRKQENGGLTEGLSVEETTSILRVLVWWLWPIFE
ncbi:hypothetical protein Tco_0373393 [Tanacetum coccineum]